MVEVLYNTASGFDIRDTPGELSFIYDNCIACGLCEPECPEEIIFVRATYVSGGNSQNEFIGADFRLAFNNCIMCGDCANVCPTAALSYASANQTPPPPPSGDGGGEGGNGNATTAWNNFYVNKIKYKNLSDCFESITNKIIAGGTTGIMSTAIESFVGSSPAYTWTISNGSLPTNQNGNTSYTDADGAVTIIDDSKFTDSTDLAKMRTVLHEGIHAYLASLYYNDPSMVADIYSSLIDNWAKLQDQGTPNAQNQAHHNLIVNRFLDDMALSLKMYGDANNYNLSLDFYKDLSWGGLTDTKAFKALSQTEQDRIKDSLSVEQTGYDTHGNAGTQKGKAGGCGD